MALLVISICKKNGKIYFTSPLMSFCCSVPRYNHTLKRRVMIFYSRVRILKVKLKASVEIDYSLKQIWELKCKCTEDINLRSCGGLYFFSYTYPNDCRERWCMYKTHSNCYFKYFVFQSPPSGGLQYRLQYSPICRFWPVCGWKPDVMTQFPLGPNESARFWHCSRLCMSGCGSFLNAYNRKR